MKIDKIETRIATPATKEIAKCYCEVWDSEDLEGTDAFIRRYAQHPDFISTLGWQACEVSGYGFGSAFQKENWWCQEVLQQIPEHPVSLDGWVLVNLGVKEKFRNLGFGSEIHDALMNSVRARWSILSTESANEAAIRFYLRKGWKIEVSDMVFPSGPKPFSILTRDRFDIL